ncbi:hypothetical protein [Leeuwenhoekiella sp. NPDC079379]|uniref:hypothetical protein n=1 Tax=Leeuwenhoekiella sp. NPDC079379 TaxID=3364122 RepID=UPI0037C8E4A8
MKIEEEIIDDTYIEQLIDAAFIGGGRYIEVKDSGKNFARLESGIYSFRSHKTLGEVKRYEGVELVKLKKILFGLIAKYSHFKTNEHNYHYFGGKWNKTYDLGK